MLCVLPTGTGMFFFSSTIAGSTCPTTSKAGGKRHSYNCVMFARACATALRRQSSGTVIARSSGPSCALALRRPCSGSVIARALDGTSRRFCTERKAAAPSLWTRARSKLGHIYDFFSSYLRGVKLFGSEVRVATRLAWRVYGQGKRTSRLERLQMRQSVGDVVRVVPLAGLFLVFGLELTTMAILRYMPSLLPRAMRQAVVPAAQKLGVAPSADTDATKRKRLALSTDLGQGGRALAPKAGLATAEALLARVDDGNSTTKVRAVEIAAARGDFADGKVLSLDGLPKPMVEQLAMLHLPSGVSLPGPERLTDLVGAVASQLTPTLVLRRRLRE
jgi:hypothetical protein